MSQAGTDLLIKALEILDRDGWCRQSYVKANGTKCTVGALGAAACEGDERLTEEAVRLGARMLMVAAFVHPTALEATARLSKVVEEPQDRLMPVNDIGRLITWNDHESRTYEDVVLAFKKAIEGE